MEELARRTDIDHAHLLPSLQFLETKFQDDSVLFNKKFYLPVFLLLTDINCRMAQGDKDAENDFGKIYSGNTGISEEDINFNLDLSDKWYSFNEEYLNDYYNKRKKYAADLAQ